ncbi:hypothetical protein ENUP19_0240G0002 [Entamoeba nuttalli]|uniref:Leucine rich repeat protein, BspA family protein n=1 Tax=Entamoeba nuttalli TaxID=412467 RepID=A0ABQ0DQ69_9EUKA
MEETYQKDTMEYQTNVFSGSNDLMEINIPTHIEMIGNECFKECTRLSIISIPTSVIKIRYSCFCVCSSLTLINLPTNVSKIGNGSFK